jgi:hypothetical protein
VDRRPHSTMIPFPFRGPIVKFQYRLLIRLNTI